MELVERLRLCTKTADVAGDRAAASIITEAADLLEEALKALETARDYVADTASGALTFSDSGDGLIAMAKEDLAAINAILTKSQGEKIDTPAALGDTNAA